MEMHKDLPLLHFEKYEEWISWLDTNHDKCDAVWIKFAKKASGLISITYEEAREGALIYGWIDGVKNALDENFYTLRFTPRRPKSIWSKINVEIVENLIKEGKMKPSGIKEVESAKLDGRWDRAYESQSTIQIPEDFQKALEQSPKAYEFFKTINSTNRYAFLYRIHNAKKAETREANIKKFIKMLENGEVFYPKNKA